MDLKQVLETHIDDKQSAQIGAKIKVEAGAKQQMYELLFGSIAGMVGKVVEYPFDTVKVRLQSQPVNERSFQGPWQCLAQTFKNEGMRGLYQGLTSPVIGSMIENAFLFFAYNETQRLIREYSATPKERMAIRNTNPELLPPLSIQQLCVAGGIAGAFVSLILTPVELVKCKMQVQDAALYDKNAVGSYRGPLTVISDTFKQHGIKGFYRGHLGTFLRESGGGAAWFGTYEFLCRWFQQSTGKKKSELSEGYLMTAGAIAGVAYNFSLFPADVVKSQMQTEEELMALRGVAVRRRSFMEVSRELWRNEGLRGFYRGCGITLFKSAPASAVIFLTYEFLMRNWSALGS
ncbi:uncharacterized protein VTP21DRAFT_5179 [Calcarisporiella thermophila]|uniref:uncharacterized protein n=1 Tax=Calcarisporiella thermophila TaxID=911321 RepID=UPI0037430EDE